MELREEVFNDLKYAQEHLACDCYMSKEDSGSPGKPCVNKIY